MFLGMSLELWFITTILPVALMGGVWLWSRVYLRKLDEQIAREKQNSASGR